MLDPICISALKNNIKYVTIPLLEESSLLDKQKRDRFKNILIYFVKKYPAINFSLEAEMPSAVLRELLSLSNNVCVTYDTGNMTSCGYKHEEYIEEIFDRISNVHLKDRTIGGKTVVPLTGNTEFEKIFKTLIKNNYQNVFTLQTAREKAGQELTTIKKHTDLLRGVYEKCI
jgi:sugar phosphate isomerase/epimerase